MISIIVPMYNCAEYIDKCIASLIEQTYKDIEIILVDDGSTDTTAVKCRKYVEQDTRVKYIYQNNAGVSSARNTGIQSSTGEYIIFVDSDDWMSLEGIEILYKKLIESKVDLVVGSHSRICMDKEEENIFQNSIFRGQQNVAVEVSDKYMTAVISSPWAKIYKRDILNDIRFCEEISLGEDLLFNLHYFSMINSFEIVSDIIYFYADVNVNSLSKIMNDNTFETLQRIYEVAKNYFDSVEKKYNYKINRKACSDNFMKPAIAYIVYKVECGNNYKDCDGYIRKICQNPLFLDAISVVKNRSMVERVLIYLLRHKCYYAVYFFTRCWVFFRRIVKFYRRDFYNVK